MKKYVSDFSLILLVFLCLIVLYTCKKLEKEMMVSTGDVTNIQTNSVDAAGVIIDLGGGATQHGHCYGKIPNVSTSSSKSELGAPKDNGGFTSQLKNLDAGTLYYIKAYISDGSIFAYGKEISFTTATSSPPTLTTTAASAITTNSASSGGNITSDGGSAVTARGVCWSTATGPTIANSKTSDGTGSGDFASGLAGLTVKMRLALQPFREATVTTMEHSTPLDLMVTGGQLRRSVQQVRGIGA